jgi:hypothetical protein
MKNKSFTVTLEAARYYTVTVIADDKDEAHDLALDLWCGSKDPDFDFNGQGNDVEVIRIEQDDDLFASWEYDEDYYRATAQ